MSSSESNVPCALAGDSRTQGTGSQTSAHLESHWKNVRQTSVRYLAAMLVLMLVQVPPIARALEPAEVLVIANLNTGGSAGLAKYYMKKRKIPAENFLKLRTTDSETVTYQEYVSNILGPVRQHIEDASAKGVSIRCLCLMYGVPLKILPPAASLRDVNRYAAAVNRLITPDPAKSQTLGAKKPDALGDDIVKLNEDRWASVDSEIALALADPYPLDGWIPNPFYLFFQDQANMPITREKVLLVSRLDGPEFDNIEKMIDHAIQAEKSGLKGIAYFDARWPFSYKNDLQGYALYDQSIHKTSRNFKKRGLMPVIVNDEVDVFGINACTEAAFYCGWHNPNTYVDSFVWQPGSIGYHIASQECMTLRRKSSLGWCKRMIEKGVSATIGAIGEPFIESFPLPEIFFGYIAEGGLSLAEAYMISLPYLSWKMVLIGDPLYRPFKL